MIRFIALSIYQNVTYSNVLIFCLILFRIYFIYVLIFFLDTWIPYWLDHYKLRSKSIRMKREYGTQYNGMIRLDFFLFETTDLNSLLALFQMRLLKRSINNQPIPNAVYLLNDWVNIKLSQTRPSNDSPGPDSLVQLKVLFGWTC